VVDAGVVGAVRRDLRVAALLARARVRSELQYRASFGIFLFAQLVATVTDLVAIAAIFSKVDALGGWTRAQVVLLYGVTVTGFALADLTVSSVDLVADWVRAGRYDRLLLRPAGPLAQLVGHEFQLRRLGRLVLPMAALFLGAAAADVGPDARTIALLSLAVVGSGLVFAALFVLTACLAFWSPDAEEVASAFTYGGQLASQYPTSVYDVWVRRWLFSVVPVGLASYAPVRAVVGAPNPLDLAGWTAWAGPFVALPVAGLSALVWRLGNRRYASTGS
jgi:ABC-2 type transport system permease protein